MRKVSIFTIISLLFFVLAACEYINPPVDTNPVITDDPVVITPVNIESFDRLFNDDMKKSLKIVISQEQWDDLNQSLIDYNEQFGNLRADTYVRADLVFEDDLGEVTIPDIGLRTKGNLSRVLIQNPDDTLNLSNFKLSFDEDFDLADLKANKKRTAFEMEELDMKFNRNSDSTYITEKFSLDLFNKIGVFAATTTLANLYIQIGAETHYYGIYTLFEPIDQFFLNRRMTAEEADGNLYKSLWQQFMPASLQMITNPLEIGMKDVSTNYRPTYDLKTNQKTGDTSDILDFITQINTLNDADFKTFVEDYVDVEMFLKYLAVGVLLGNPDDYRAMGNNYYFFHNNVVNIWQMIPFDYDHGLAQGWTAEPVFSNYTVGMDIYEWGNVNQYLLNQESYPHPLVDRILSIQSYQIEYESYLADLVDPENEMFSYDQFFAMYDTQKDLYDEMVDDAMMNLHFGLRNIEWYMNAKVEDIQSQLSYYNLHPDQRGT